MLISPEQARAHLRLELDDIAPDLDLKISAAEIMAAEFLGRQLYVGQAELDAAVLAGTAGEAPMVCNDLIRAAMLLTLGHLYANREDVLVGVAANALPLGAHSLLQPYRTGLGV